MLSREKSTKAELILRDLKYVVAARAYHCYKVLHFTVRIDSHWTTVVLPLNESLVNVV